MRAIKDNRQYTITELDVKNYQREGFDIYDDDGNIVAYGHGKTVSFEKYMKLVGQVEELQEEIITLQEEIITLKEKLAKPKRQSKEKENDV